MKRISGIPFKQSILGKTVFFHSVLVLILVDGDGFHDKHKSKGLTKEREHL